MTNELRRKLCENCWRDNKIFPQTWKITKIQTNTVPTEPRTFFVFVEKLAGDGSQRTVRESGTNYTNIVFANTMFANVYAALGYSTFS